MTVRPLRARVLVKRVEEREQCIGRRSCCFISQLRQSPKSGERRTENIQRVLALKVRRVAALGLKPRDAVTLVGRRSRSPPSVRSRGGSPPTGHRGSIRRKF